MPSKTGQPAKDTKKAGPKNKAKPEATEAKKEVKGKKWAIQPRSRRLNWLPTGTPNED